jgi:hypothetical protein
LSHFVKQWQALLFDKAANEKRSVRFSGYPPRGREKTGVNAVLNDRWRSAKPDPARELITHGYVDEYDLVGDLKHTATYGAVTNALKGSNRSPAVWDFGNMLRYHDRAVQATGGDHCHDVECVQTVVDVDRIRPQDCGLDPARFNGRWKGIWEAKPPLRHVPRANGQVVRISYVRIRRQLCCDPPHLMSGSPVFIRECACYGLDPARVFLVVVAENRNFHFTLSIT